MSEVIHLRATRRQGAIQIGTVIAWPLPEGFTVHWEPAVVAPPVEYLYALFPISTPAEATEGWEASPNNPDKIYVNLGWRLYRRARK